jgi:parallel beta-helix repeat protein
MVGNMFIGNHFGIFLTSSAYSIISKNDLIKNRDSINLAYSYSNIISENNIIDNLHGINFEGQYDYPTYNNTISKNYISNSFNYGIRLYSFCNENTITENNVIDNQKYGILIFGNENNKINNNNIKNTNGIGVCLDYTTDNRIYSNNFINNQKDAQFTYSPGVLFKANRWERNYWNTQRLHPKCIFGRMKIWIVPFPWVDFDWHPGQEPYNI